VCVRVSADVSAADVGNYTCRIGGPHNTLVASVTHELSVRGMTYASMHCVQLLLASPASAAQPISLLTIAVYTQSCISWPLLGESACRKLEVFFSPKSYYDYRTTVLFLFE